MYRRCIKCSTSSPTAHSNPVKYILLSHFINTWGETEASRNEVPYPSSPVLKWPSVCMRSKSLQSCPTFCNLVECRLLCLQSPWTPLSMGFSRQEYWSGLPCLPPGDLPNPGIEPMSLMSPALAGRFFTTSATWEAHNTPVSVCSWILQ